MSKDNDKRDIGRRYKFVSKLQDQISDPRRLPAPNYKWPTALIIVPVTLIANWKREFDTVSIICWNRFAMITYSFVTSTVGLFRDRRVCGERDASRQCFNRL